MQTRLQQEASAVQSAAQLQAQALANAESNALLQPQALCVQSSAPWPLRSSSLNLRVDGRSCSPQRAARASRTSRGWGCPRRMCSATCGSRTFSTTTTTGATHPIRIRFRVMVRRPQRHAPPIATRRHFNTPIMALLTLVVGRAVFPDEENNCLSNLLFCWVWPLLSEGASRPLQKEVCLANSIPKQAEC